jgi:caspase domain-containing protein
VTRLVRRRALLIGNEHYDDSRFLPLPSTRADIWGLEQVLRHRNIGGFGSITSRDNLTADDMRMAISEFMGECEPDELALVYFSGHGTRLVRDGGEFHFIATDTDFDRIAETGVSASFVNEQLEQGWAAQKIMMIDCCRSGGFAVGLRTSDRQPLSVAKSAEQEQPLLTSRGVYVLSSSRAGEDSYADRDSTGEVRPSAFTAEVIEALRTGKVSRDGKGDVSVEDLFHYVNRRMRAQGARQVPVKFAHAVDDRIVIADCPLGAAPLLAPLTRQPASSPEQSAQGMAPKSARAEPTWPRLLDYYRECLLSDETKTPLMSVGERETSYVCLSGTERFLSGEVEDDGCVPVPAEAEALIESATEQEAELWAGYPAVVVTGPRGGRPWRHPKFAPLLIRRVEIVSQEGQVGLKPYGPVQPHPQLARDWLGEEEAAQLADTFQPTWHRGQHDRLAVEARKLLMEEFEIPCVQELHPDQLADRIDIHTPGHGARNAAVLFVSLPDTAYTKKLLDDFADIVGTTDRTPGDGTRCPLPCHGGTHPRAGAVGTRTTLSGDAAALQRGPGCRAALRDDPASDGRHRTARHRKEPARGQSRRHNGDQRADRSRSLQQQRGRGRGLASLREARAGKCHTHRLGPGQDRELRRDRGRGPAVPAHRAGPRAQRVHGGHGRRHRCRAIEACSP